MKNPNHASQFGTFGRFSFRDFLNLVIGFRIIPLSRWVGKRVLKGWTLSF